MIANYGYADGSGSYYITMDTDRCEGCGDCARDCPAGILAMVPNPYDPLAEQEIVTVREEYIKKINVSCAPCKPASGWISLPCIEACPAAALTHSW